MCNYSHEDRISCKESGVAYKIVEKKNNGLYSLNGGVSFPSFTEWFVWNVDKYIITRYGQRLIDWAEEWEFSFKEKDISNFGFCFVPTKKEAMRLRNLWQKVTLNATVIRKVKYRKGIGIHEEDGLILGEFITTLIAKEFKFVQEDKIPSQL